MKVQHFFVSKPLVMTSYKQPKGVRNFRYPLSITAAFSIERFLPYSFSFCILSWFFFAGTAFTPGFIRATVSNMDFLIT